uniref:F-box associated beta-propeller type 3 domain-containing protein n=1 Tax=Oryza sativa subsp. japonica TaxID=39947 RepID=Q6K2G0_ORYSJ|nr:hypothetical protein [Oryza sativa Japonica Group]
MAAPPLDITAEIDPMLHKSIPKGGRITRHIIPTHCDGLVAFATYGRAMFVCNPATQELVVLPPGSGSGPCPQSTESTAAVGFNLWWNRYIVVRCFYRKSHNDLPVYDIGHEIFTLGAGAGDGWQRMQDPSRAISLGGRRPAACTRGGSIYRFINESQPCALLWFSLRDEAFDAVPSSPGCTACDNDDRLADLAGELCYVHRIRTSVATHEVWMAAAVDDDDQEWWLRYRVDLWHNPWGVRRRCGGGGNGQRWFHSFGATAAGDVGGHVVQGAVVSQGAEQTGGERRERVGEPRENVSVRKKNGIEKGMGVGVPDTDEGLTAAADTGDGGGCATDVVDIGGGRRGQRRPGHLAEEEDGSGGTVAGPRGGGGRQRRPCGGCPGQRRPGRAAEAEDGGSGNRAARLRRKTAAAGPRGEGDRRRQLCGARRPSPGPRG